MTSVELNRKDKKRFQLPQDELQRIQKILKKAVDKESGKLSENDVSLTEDNPDGRKLLFRLYSVFFFVLTFILDDAGKQIIAKKSQQLGLEVFFFRILRQNSSSNLQSTFQFTKMKTS